MLIFTFFLKKIIIFHNYHRTIDNSSKQKRTYLRFGAVCIRNEKRATRRPPNPLTNYNIVHDTKNYFFQNLNVMSCKSSPFDTR